MPAGFLHERPQGPGAQRRAVEPVSASPAQHQRWLLPLLEGKIRSAFAMSEPDVASSDAGNVQTLIRRDGEHYVLNGCKWFIANACHPQCRLLIVMGKTDPEAAPYRQ